MSRILIVITAALSMTACGQWKGDGSDEAIPDVLGMITGVRKSEGVPSETLHTDHADDDIRMNHPSQEEIEAGEKSGHPVKVPFEFGH